MITIRNLSKTFSGQKVLDSLALDIEKGQVIALVGASGAGKSTFLRSLNYLEKPDSGSISIGDFTVDFETITTEQVLILRRKLAMVFQQFNLLSVVQPLRMSKKVLRWSKNCLTKKRLNWRKQNWLRLV